MKHFLHAGFRERARFSYCAIFKDGHEKSRSCRLGHDPTDDPNSSTLSKASSI